MKVGNFFKVDEHTNYKNGNVYYRYLPVHYKASKGGESDYPIYVNISSSEISFFIQGRICSQVLENSSEEDSYTRIDNGSVEENRPPTFYNHSELFHIPFSDNLREKDNLAGILKRLEDEEVEQLTSNLYTVDAYIQNKNCDETNNEIVIATYSDFDVFLLDKHPSLFFKTITKKIYYWREKKSETHILSYKRIILDFLFDLEHSRVFQNSPAYEKMEDALAEYPFFVALSAKYDYY